MVEHMFERWERLPEGLAEMAPGSGLATVLASVDRSRLSGFDRVILMQAWHRQVAHDQAEFYASMLAVADAEIEELSAHLELDEIYGIASSEIRAALTLTRRSADYQLGFALQLVKEYPLIWEALRHGVIDLPKARVIIGETCHLDAELRAKVSDAALERAPHQTTGQLGARIRKLVNVVDPESAKTRYEQGVAERRVVRQANDDGTTNLSGLQLPVHRANAAMRRINELARAAKSADDPRTMDQIRADVLLDLLQGRQSGHSRGTRGTVDIHVDLTTLAELTENPGEIAGYGPVIADIARQVAESQPDSEWRYTITDGDGVLVHNGITRRRPAAVQQRRVEAQDPICVFPGCRMPAGECDLDHTHGLGERWTDRRRQPRSAVPTRPPAETSSRVGGATPPTRHVPMDQSTRPYLPRWTGTGVAVRCPVVREELGDRHAPSEVFEIGSELSDDRPGQIETDRTQ